MIDAADEVDNAELPVDGVVCVAGAVCISLGVSMSVSESDVSEASSSLEDDEDDSDVSLVVVVVARWLLDVGTFLTPSLDTAVSALASAYAC